MIRSWALMAVAVVFSLGIGCSGDHVSEQHATPCDRCDYGYVPVKHTSERRVWCIKDGKMLDCQKTPAECPECRKMLHQDTRPPAD